MVMLASLSRTVLATSASRQAVPLAKAVVANAALSSNLRRSYHSKVIDHYENPRNVGTLPKTDTDVGTGLVGAPACGDVMRLQIRVNDKGIIEQAVFKTFGCGSAIASSSFMTERIKGLSVYEASKIKNTEIAKELCLPPVKLHCSMLAEDAINAAIKNYHSKRKEGLTGAGTIDVSQSVVTGKTEATANPGSPSAA